jgi:integrase
MPSLIQDKQTKIYKVRDRRGGKDRQHSLGTTDKAVAQQRFGKWLAAHGGDKWREVQHSFDEAALLLIEERLPRLRPNSVKAYAHHLENLRQHFEGKMLSDIGRADLSAYEHARWPAVKPGTILAELSVLSAIFDGAIGAEWITVNPVPAYLRGRKRKGLTASPPQTRYLSLEEEERLLRAARRQPDGDMVVAALMLSIDTGLRSEELFGLPWADIDLVRKEITVQAERAKSGKERRVPILPRAEKLLRGLQRHYASPYVLHRGDGARLRSLRPALRGLVAEAGLAPLRWHDLRRTCGCRLLQVHKLPMHAVSAWLGHASTVVTESTYAFLRVDDLHAAVGTLRGPETVIKPSETLETVNDFKALPVHSDSTVC